MFRVELEYQFDFLAVYFVVPSVWSETLAVPENNVHTYKNYDVYPS